MLTIYTARHGQSMANATYTIQGQTSTPLSELGLKQAQALQKRLKDVHFDAVYSSDLERAMQTAAIAAPYTTPIPTKAMREWHLGIFQGHTRDEAQKLAPEAWAAFIKADPLRQVPDGESAMDVNRRVWSFMDELVQRHTDGTILVVSHSGALRALLRKAIGMPDLQPWTKGPAMLNTAVSIFNYDAGVWSLTTWNDYSHLNDLVANTGNY